MQKITPCLWFDGKAQEAARFYTSVFKNSKMGASPRYGDTVPGKKGSGIGNENRNGHGNGYGHGDGIAVPDRCRHGGCSSLERDANARGLRPGRQSARPGS